MFFKFKIYILAFLIISACTSTYKPPYELTKQPPKARKIENVNVALVLGGGGARGIAHLGVLEVLQENNIPIDLIVGTSVGSVIGAMYADHKDHRILTEKFINLKRWDLLDLSYVNFLSFFSELKGPIQGYYLENFIAKNMSVKNIEELKIPFIAVATDINEEVPYIFESGPIAMAVHASSAIPPIFTPIEAYGKLLVDGGVVEAVPVNIAKRYHPKVIIAINISIGGHSYALNDMLDLTGKAMSASYNVLSSLQSSSADIVINPDLKGYDTFYDGNNKLMYEIGKKAAQDKIPEIIKLLKFKKILN